MHYKNFRFWRQHDKNFRFWQRRDSSSPKVFPSPNVLSFNDEISFRCRKEWIWRWNYLSLPKVPFATNLLSVVKCFVTRSQNSCSDVLSRYFFLCCVDCLVFFRELKTKARQVIANLSIAKTDYRRWVYCLQVITSIFFRLHLL